MKTKGPTHVDKHVGKLIRLYRLQASMSQTKLGEALGLTFQQIQKYENGTNRVGVGRLTAIAETLKIPINAFFISAENAAEFKQNEQALLALLADDRNLQMLKAFSKITDPGLQQILISLAEAVAK